MDQNLQFIITVGTVIGVFLWLRHDINQLNMRIDKVSDDLNARIDSLSSRMERLNENYAAVRESLGWITGRMGFSEQTQTSAE